ncbi:general secretion pathway protein I [Pseudomonas duriflava]|uniref:General secretion pathway protein I n=1 Tax=Pseudomonas duriflava TaxID=459528 RepID=A0A562QIW5_9PSED|nr:prepilin-type N-terminal cleavage/methylation domain-containing protein [Pseudomonas duriflava]TWI56681.1 general secretion pathway protein I [Pseudomonas duriflava]
MIPRVRTQQGFTLLELLAAIALLAITFFVVMGGIGQATHALLKDNRATRMALVARSLLDESVHTLLQPGTSNGRLTDGTAWRLDIARVETQSALQLYRLDLTLTVAGHRERFSTLRIQGGADNTL